MDLQAFLFVALNVALYLEVEGVRQQYVSCGSVLKLINVSYKIRLHSHDVKYGTGSSQQSVTGVDHPEDVNSHWLVKAKTGENCNRGEPVKCGDVVRFEHLTTEKNLHSHMFSSPLSGSQEISCYGEKGLGDTGDHWEIVCQNDFWERDDAVILKHIDTGAYLATSGRTYGRPINGQMEIVGVKSLDEAVQWRASEGLFIHPPEPLDRHSDHVHTEL